MNKYALLVSLISLTLSGCTTLGISDKSDHRKSDDLVPISEGENAERRDQIRQVLREYQMRQIREGLPPLPIPLTEENIASIQAEMKAAADDPSINSKAEITPELQKLILDSCTRQTQQSH